MTFRSPVHSDSGRKLDGIWMRSVFSLCAKREPKLELPYSRGVFLSAGQAAEVHEWLEADDVQVEGGAELVDVGCGQEELLFPLG